MPGLTDMHTHFLGLGDDAPILFSFLASGVTAIRHTNPVSDQEGYQHRHPTVAEEKLSPYIYLAGNMREFARPEMSADQIAAEYKMAGYNFTIGAGDSLRAAARRLGLPSGSHDHSMSFEQMLPFGADGLALEHLYAFRSALGLRSWGKQATREPTDIAETELRALAAATHRAGVWITPTLNCVANSWTSSPSSRVMLQLVKALHDAGLGLLMAGDDARDIHQELALLVHAGLTPYQALLTGTRNVARYFGLDDSTGTVATGKRADLVLLYHNPLQDIRHTREPAGVMRAGRWLDRAELDRRLLISPKTWFALALNATPSNTGYGIGRPSFINTFTAADGGAGGNPRASDETRAVRDCRPGSTGMDARASPARRSGNGPGRDAGSLILIWKMSPPYPREESYPAW